MARAKPASPLIPRSVRIPQNVWDIARKRATEEGTTITAAVTDLLEGYARGVYELPRVRTVKQFPKD